MLDLTTMPIVARRPRATTSAACAPGTGSPSQRRCTSHHGYSNSQHAEPSPPRLRRFLAWLLVGVAFAFSLLAIFSIGVPLLRVAVVASVMLAWRSASTAGAFGVISGLGLPMLDMAFMNRSGPGTICTTTRTSQSCIDELNPVPWLVIGVTLIALGVVGFVLRQHGHTGKAQRPSPGECPASGRLQKRAQPADKPTSDRRWATHGADGRRTNRCGASKWLRDESCAVARVR